MILWDVELLLFGNWILVFEMGLLLLFPSTLKMGAPSS
jgi:hypothetical protein